MTDRDLQEAAMGFEVHKTSDSHFSWVRTRLSLERTLLAWERTATSLLGFGFTIAKFFEYLDESDNVRPGMLEHAPRVFGLTLIGTSSVILAIAFWQYLWAVKYLRGPPFDLIAPPRPRKMNSPALAVCGILFWISTATFFAVIARVF